MLYKVQPADRQAESINYEFILFSWYPDRRTSINFPVIMFNVQLPRAGKNVLLCKSVNKHNNILK